MMSTGIIKLNNSTDVIPSGHGYQGDRRNDHNYRPIMKKPQSKLPYFGDPMIVPRVKQYLEEHSTDVRIDFENMVDTLQSKYRDYAKRKRNAFKGLVDRAYSAVLYEFSATMTGSSDKNVDVYSSDSSRDESFEADQTMDVFNESGNNQIMAMYATQNKSKRSGRAYAEGQELINISSSEDEENGKKRPRTIPHPAALSILPATKNAITVNKIVPPPSYNGNKPIVSSTPAPPVVQPSSTPIRVVPSINVSRKRKATEMINGGKPLIGPQKKKREVPITESRITFKDFGGNSKVLEEVCKLLVHVRHPEVYRQIGISPPRGFLLHGPPGCGKTLLAQAIAGELDVPLIKVASTELVAGVSGESEERIRDLFDQAALNAPCVLFLDEVDAITPNRHTAQREMERRIVAQLLTCLDDLGQKENGDQVLVIGATNRPDALDPALRRAGRFDREVCLGIPDLKSRVMILKVVCAKLRIADDLSFEEIARNTPGFVGADLTALTREAAMAAVNRVFGDLKKGAQKQREEEEAEAAQEILEKDVLKDVEEVVVVDKPIEVIDSIEFKDDDIIALDKDSKIDEKSKDNEEIEEIKDDDDQETKSKTKDNNVKETKDETKDDSKKEDLIKDDVKKDSKKDDVKKDSKKDYEESKSKDDEEAGKDSKGDGSITILDDQSKMDVCSDDPSVPIKQPDVQIATEEAVFGPVLEELISWLHDISPLPPHQLEGLHVEKSDFDHALKVVQPSAKREGFATVPDVTWDDVGSLQDIRDELQMAILVPVRHPEQFASLGLSTPTGVLLCGPPGCGKTLLAKAVANEAGINFISVKGPELLNMYVGESERAVRQCFQRARNSAPCVIFFDELDALCPKRSDSGEGGASMRVVNQMLTEMDGIEGRKGVYLMAATNRPDIVDPAVLRPGRLDKILYVGLPTGPDRVLILEALTKKGTKPTLASDVSLTLLGECDQCSGYTGADLAALVREAGIEALKEFFVTLDDTKTLVVAHKHFQKALKKIRPSVSTKDQKYYETLREIYTAIPKH